MKFKKGFLFILFIVLSGCTAKGYYKSLQPDDSSCRSLPIAQRDACYKEIKNQMSYEEYKEERKKL